jgi:hypothetical protein
VRKLPISLEEKGEPRMTLICADYEDELNSHNCGHSRYPRFNSFFLLVLVAGRAGRQQSRRRENPSVADAGSVGGEIERDLSLRAEATKTM